MDKSLAIEDITFSDQLLCSGHVQQDFQQINCTLRKDVNVQRQLSIKLSRMTTFTFISSTI